MAKNVSETNLCAAYFQDAEEFKRKSDGNVLEAGVWQDGR